MVVTSPSVHGQPNAFQHLQAAPSPPLATASNLVLIDNYDSFTWNVYQFLVLEGANVTVFRNDELTLDELIDKNPTQLVISPGPGHPNKDAGISGEAIKHFGGRIPVLGVCMGAQCIFTAFGGTVDVTGEIIHGKTSALKHDGQGIYEGIEQDVPVTRYHSLAGTYPTLPECLEMTSWTEQKGVPSIVMGVRHKTFTVEGVQFHPESILTGEGRRMIQNFLQVQGGKWATDGPSSKAQGGVSSANEPAVQNGVDGSQKTDTKRSILDEIFARRKVVIGAQKLVPSKRPSDLDALYSLDLAPPQISFPERLRNSPFKMSLMAEIKRASPSRGIISLDVCAPVQARSYALAGASVISVLTEPDWFKGSIEDLRAVRQVLESMPNRPAVLLKDFVFDKYQILEARLAGADTVLLIVKSLHQQLLEELYAYSLSLGMVPLVEVNTSEEMQTTLKLGAKVIGINNRNLVNFEVDLQTTSRLLVDIPSDVQICALSGIKDSNDVDTYRDSGVKAVLIGEALMRAQNPSTSIQGLFGGDGLSAKPASRRLLVKICGVRTSQAARTAIEAGADMVGMILVQGSRRQVSEENARDISHAVHATRRSSDGRPNALVSHPGATNFSSHAADHFLSSSHRTLLVGVFQNQPLEYILQQQRLLDLDVVQLHGNEPVEWAAMIPVPVLRFFKLGQTGMQSRGYHALPLLDAGTGGSGQSIDGEALKRVLEGDDNLRIMLAGGLDAQNLTAKLQQLGSVGRQVVAVDVSSGVESSGAQDPEKIKAFVAAARVFDDVLY